MRSEPHNLGGIDRPEDALFIVGCSPPRTPLCKRCHTDRLPIVRPLSSLLPGHPTRAIICLLHPRPSTVCSATHQLHTASKRDHCIQKHKQTLHRTLTHVHVYRDTHAHTNTHNRDTHGYGAKRILALQPHAVLFSVTVRRKCKD